MKAPIVKKLRRKINSDDYYVSRIIYYARQIDALTFNAEYFDPRGKTEAFYAQKISEKYIKRYENKIAFLSKKIGL